ncbi:MAG: AAA family ATPase [Candidatus Altiarchaeota archaeon]|nr:AAA family ATPase [Candidatus Altiarchaeota archaeon]
MEKINTGAPGLDDMLGGGLVRGRPYLLCGGPGVGKTILAIQFLREGLLNAEKVLYISLEETADQLKNDMSEFGWDISDIDVVDTAQEITEGKMFLRTDEVGSHPEFTLSSLIEVINSKLDKQNIKRIVIDSLTSVMSLYESKVDMRRNVMSLMNFLSTTDCTTLIIDEVGGLSRLDSVMEEFLASGVIKIHTVEKKGEMLHSISIEKMRGSDFDKHIRPMKITSNGVVVFPEETLFE